ncbi:MAG: S41 family peptidase [Anaeromyxobacter sp.]|nr:S41 family peptidase [Anaeromyxobacter sp.]MBL0275785.1 S41 family peptidase [Anaeromyxobacter sp.]
MRPSPLRRLLGPLLVGAAFLAGLSVNHVAQAARRSETYRPLDVFADVLAHVENSYVEEVDERELVYGAVDGLVGRLDPHSVFLRPEVFKALRDETTGEFDGLGLELTVREGQLTVISPMADSPGERAGIRPGDHIVSIDGSPARDLTLAEAIRRLKGAVGTTVALELMREGFSAPQRLTLVRDRIRLQSVDWRVLDGPRRYAYVRIKAFQERTDRALEKALGEARATLKGELRGLVLDLRNDPGGLLDQAVRVSDRWLTGGVIVTTEGRGRRNVEVEKAREKDTEPAYPLIVLVNKGTASASEIVAGALQDHQRAVIMGTPTFGKGSVQTIIELEDGAGLKLTVARYYTPRHRSIQEHGITPDVVVADAAPQAREDGPGERDLKRHLRNEAGDRAAGPGGAGAAPPGGPGRGAPAEGPGDDYQLRTALDYLKAVDIFKSAGAAPALPR